MAVISRGVSVCLGPDGVRQISCGLTAEGPAGSRVAGYDVIADPARLARLELAVLDD